MNKTPFITKEQALKIAADGHPTPYHIYDEAGLRACCSAVREAFAWNPGFREYFAVKATPNPILMELMTDYDFGFDCSSESELLLAGAVLNNTGADGGCEDRTEEIGKHIMFSSNETPACEYALAHKLHAIINLDDITHIPFLASIIGDEFPETMCCRFNPGGVFTMSNGIMDNPGDSKYGMTLEQLKDAYRQLRDHGVKHFGIHAFLASNTVSNEYYPILAGQLFEIAKQIHEELGIHFAFINLSGGVGIPYRPEQEPNDIYVIGEGVRQQFEKILVPAGMGDIAIYTEMGRFITAPYGALVTQAVHEKHIYKEYIGVDACAANLMRPAMYGAYHHITVLGKEDAPAEMTYDIVGSLCENNDKFAIDRNLPIIEKEDYLFIHDTGAHGSAMGYNYNGRLWSAELLLHTDGSVEEIRRAQTLQDYFATLDGTRYAGALGLR
ncbi:MAG: diaminopimelate decarboxylase [Lachnospiraceae bacterium]|nr:diaminopimelate decarboxylase [Lachnospiraceae bacterium]